MTLTTKIHTYSFDTQVPAEAEAYAALKVTLKATHGRGRWMHVNHSYGDEARNHQQTVIDAEASGTITLESECLFSNQWNSTGAGRVFDWYAAINHEAPHRKSGHYLDITPEMVAISETTLKCGYTGQQFPAATDLKFNTTQAGIGSVYLQEEQLYMLRLVPVFAENQQSPRAELTEEERALLMPLYIAAQTKNKSDARVKQRADVLKKAERAMSEVTTERDGFLWLLDHGVNIENCIYYHHTDKFSFGWRDKFPKSAEPALLLAIDGFPFDYEVLTS